MLVGKSVLIGGLFQRKTACTCSGLVGVKVSGLEEWLLAIALICLHQADDHKDSLRILESSKDSSIWSSPVISGERETPIRQASEQYYQSPPLGSDFFLYLLRPKTMAIGPWLGPFWVCVWPLTVPSRV